MGLQQNMSGFFRSGWWHQCPPEPAANPSRPLLNPSRPLLNPSRLKIPQSRCLAGLTRANNGKVFNPSIPQNNSCKKIMCLISMARLSADGEWTRWLAFIETCCHLTGIGIWM